MRLIDADALQTALVDKYRGIDGYKTREKFYQAIEIVRRQPTIAPPPNDPLTLEQLREIDGEPVWVVQVEGKLHPFWMLVDTEDESASSRLYAAMFEDYGTEWLAYRRKLEDENYEL